MNKTTSTTTVETPVVTPRAAPKPRKAVRKASKATGWEPRLPQVRILRALVKQPLTRGDAARKAGFQPGSGTATVAINGRKAAGVVGLVKAKAVEVVEIDVDGRREELLKITGLGKRALKAALNGSSKLPSLRDAALCTNDRFTGKPSKKRKAKTK